METLKGQRSMMVRYTYYDCIFECTVVGLGSIVHYSMVRTATFQLKEKYTQPLTKTTSAKMHTVININFDEKH